MVVICGEPSNKISFHARELKIDTNKIELKSVNYTGISFNKILEYDEERLYFTLHMSRECEKNAKYILTVPFSGKISSYLYGFYQSSYISNGKNYK